MNSGRAIILKGVQDVGVVVAATDSRIKPELVADDPPAELTVDVVPVIELGRRLDTLSLKRGVDVIALKAVIRVDVTSLTVEEVSA
jgi:hypothetical protein